MSKPLLVRFRDEGSEHGADRATLKEVAKKLGVSETMAIHIAINRMHQRLFPVKHNEEFPSDEALRQIKMENPEKPAVIVDDIRDRLTEHEPEKDR